MATMPAWRGGTERGVRGQGRGGLSRQRPEGPGRAPRRRPALQRRHRRAARGGECLGRDRHPHRRRLRSGHARPRPRGRGGPRPHWRRRAGGHPSRGHGLRATAPPRARGQPRPRERPRVRGPAGGPLSVSHRGRGQRRGGGARRGSRGHRHQLGRARAPRRVGVSGRAPQRGRGQPARSARGGRGHRGRRAPLRGPAGVDRERVRRLSPGPARRRDPGRATSGRSSERCSRAGSPGRTSREEITLFKSLGLAVEDLAAAALLHRRAREQEAGTWVEL